VTCVIGLVPLEFLSKSKEPFTPAGLAKTILPKLASDPYRRVGIEFGVGWNLEAW
jgi:hypothetical protein